MRHRKIWSRTKPKYETLDLDSEIQRLKKPEWIKILQYCQGLYPRAQNVKRHKTPPIYCVNQSLITKTQ
jgi:hypothetical protein